MLHTRTVEHSGSNVHKRHRPAPLGVAWTKTQQECFDSAEDGAFYVKNGRFTFGSFESKQAFVSRWCESNYEQRLPIFELITHGACALYFDVEQTVVVPPSSIQTWISVLIEIIKMQIRGLGQEALTEDDINSVLVSSDCRASNTGYKLCFHLTWDRVTFEDNHISMQRFVKDSVNPEVKKHEEYNWVESMQRGVRTAIDLGVYTKNRAFRVAYGSTDGRTCLQPWDVAAWQPVSFNTPAEREVWFAASLITSAHHHHVVSLEPPSIDDDLTLLEWLEAASETQKRVSTKLLVPLLSIDRAQGVDGWEVWAKVGFAISQIFGKDDEGRDLFHSFSRRAQNYDEAAANHVYATSDGRVTFGSLITWAKEDDPAGAMAALRQEVRLSTPVIGNRLDEDVVHRMVEVFNQEWLPKFEDWQTGGKTPPGYHAAYETLTKNIVVYMNHWLCLIRRVTGKPHVVEEYKTEEDHTPCFVFRSQAAARGAYAKHSFRVAGSKGTQTPMTVWLTHRQSRESDTSAFQPALKKNTPRSLTR